MPDSAFSTFGGELDMFYSRPLAGGKTKAGCLVERAVTNHVTTTRCGWREKVGLVRQWLKKVKSGRYVIEVQRYQEQA